MIRSSKNTTMRIHRALSLPRSARRAAAVTLALIPTIRSAVAQSQANAPFAEDEVDFTSMPSAYHMSGTLSHPAGDGKHPAVILVWGTGPHTRDQEISGFPMFEIIAQRFNEQGYEVLRFDKRGFGRSQGPKGASEDGTTTKDLVDDVHAALQFLKTRPQVNATEIGLLGHSEGALIAQLVAQRDTNVRWLALLGCPVLTGKEIQTNQMCDNLLRLGAKPEVVAQVRPQIDHYLDFIISGYADDTLYYAIGKDLLLAHGMAEADINHKLIDQLLDGLKTPWNRQFLTLAPLQWIGKIKAPTCYFYGGCDENVTPRTNVPPLLDALATAGRKNVALTILPGLDHFFEEKLDGHWTLSPALCPSILRWLDSLK